MVELKNLPHISIQIYEYARKKFIAFVGKKKQSIYIDFVI